MAAISIQEHNNGILQSLDEGDLVEIKKGVYSHWAVYAGYEMVIHLTGDDNNGSSAYSSSGSVFSICGKTFDKALVKLDKFSEVVEGYKSCKNNSKDMKMRPREAQEIVQRGMDMLGKIEYNVLWNNCEHFASFCRYGELKSEQADFAKKSILTTLWGILVFAASVGFAVLVRSQK